MFQSYAAALWKSLTRIFSLIRYETYLIEQRPPNHVFCFSMNLILLLRKGLANPFQVPQQLILTAIMTLCRFVEVMTVPV